MSDHEQLTTAGTYDDANRAFLQGLLARGSFTLDEAKQLIAAILTVKLDHQLTPDRVSDQDFSHFLSTASSALSPYDLEIRSALSQTTRQRRWAVVNATSDALTVLATTRSPDEMAYVRRLLDAMFDTHNTRRAEVMAVDAVSALNLARPSTRDRRSTNVVLDVDGDETATAPVADRGLTSTQAERVLDGLVQEDFLERSPEGFYSLSLRGLLELRGWLVATYNDEDEDNTDESSWQRIKFCAACKEIITTGQRCRDPACNVRLHDICLDAFWRTRRGMHNGDENTCPSCGKSWEGNLFVGERAVLSGRIHSGRQGRGRSEGTAALY